MPERDLSGAHGFERTERLNRAIDRLVAGQPVPVSGDAELEDLLHLAARLHDELPRDLPDPAFRTTLKEQLLGRPPIAAPRRRVAIWSRSPYAAAASAIAAVLVVAVAVGSLGILRDGDQDTPVQVQDVARFATHPLGASSLAAATSTRVVEVETPFADLVVTPTLTSAAHVARMTQPTPESTIASTVGPEPTPPGQNAASANTPTPAADPALATVAPATEPTAGSALASLPPVDGAHLELGPGPAADGGGPPPGENVSYVLDTELPGLDQSAPVYRLAPPSVDPVQLVSQVAAALGLDGEISSGPNAFGDVDYFVGSSDGAYFNWTPESGAFSYTAGAQDGGSEASTGQVVQAAHDWLILIGYSIEGLVLAGDPEQRVDRQWEVTLVHEGMPRPGIGYPIGVIVTVASDGTVTEARGYWLALTDVEHIALASPPDIWDAVQRGEGYWTGGGIVAAGGEFRVDSMELTYVLTDGSDDGQLVLQPVVRVAGEFLAADGTSARISAFVQAARTDNP